jgi:uncharacterized membrane protein
MFLNEFIELIGTSVCHQLPSRTLLPGGIYMPTCARCSGIYIGFFISAIILFLMFRKKESSLPPIYIIILMVLFILSTIIDGALSYLTTISTNNILRLVTGFLCGSAIMVILYPIFNYEYYKEPSDKRIFHRPLKFIFFLAILAVFILLLLIDNKILGTIFYYLDFISILFTFYLINTVLLMLIPCFSKKSTKLFSIYLIAPSLIGIAMTALELFISYRLHIWLNSL